MHGNCETGDIAFEDAITFEDAVAFEDAVTFEDARYTYDGVSFALDGITLDIAAGSFVCVLGGNGSGKSTFAKHINALLTPDSGSVRTLGRNTRDEANLFFIRSNAGMVFQNPDDQIVAGVIEDDVAFGPENMGVCPDELQQRVTEALAKVGLAGYGKQETSALSGGQKQRVAIAGVLAMHPRILVLDEANAMLDPRGRAKLLETCRKLNAEGLTIVFITHFMEDAAYSTRTVVLAEGRIALDGAPEEVLVQDDRLRALSLEAPLPVRLSRLLQERGVPVGDCISLDALAGELALLLPGALATSDVLTASATVPATGDDASLPPATTAAHQQERAPVITFQDVSFTYEPTGRKKDQRRRRSQDDSQVTWGNKAHNYWALEDVQLTVHEGEFLGIAGHTGSGKSTLIQLANGLLKPTKGRVLHRGDDLASAGQTAQARRDIGLVFQYPERQLFADTVFNDVAFGPRNLGLPAEEVEERVRRALHVVDIDYEAVRDKSPFSLSGGQQRRVAIAGVLAMKPATLILDEPTAGLDPRSHDALLQLVQDLHERAGLTVVLVSHNMGDLAQYCSRLVVLNRGRLFAQGTPLQVFAHRQELHQVGLDVPPTYALASKLGLQNRLHEVPDAEQLACLIADAYRTGL